MVSAMLLAGALGLMLAARTADGRRDEPYRAPDAITLVEMAKRKVTGVAVTEVTDYAPGRYAGPMAPSPPHADGNPRRAFVVQWRGRTERLVFSHEASYCPLLELPSGAAMCNQFFEGNLGDAELFNDPGRKERNSYVSVIEAGPRRAWVRWTYLCVNMLDDTKPRLRGSEDYFSYPNGLVLRRMSYESLMPEQIVGYSTQPVELFGVAPVGAGIADLFPSGDSPGYCRVLTALDLTSDLRYDVFWDAEGRAQRSADDETLAAISRSGACALVLPFRETLLFAVLGAASGFDPDRNQLVDHCTPGAEGGCAWGTGMWDHWPIGWLNSQTSLWKPGSPYPYSFGSIGQFFVPPGKRIRSFATDYPETCGDMELNRWTERRTLAVLLGAARDEAEMRRIGRAWLAKGAACLQPESIAKLRP